SVTPRDLWRVCGTYGTVVDVFIPVKRSKVGKRFAFVRFIKVVNLDRDERIVWVDIEGVPLASTKPLL
nr:RNA-directed DNA polymerase, eukaryota, nucleotide-binding alpha-beta plait domain protein [Tanacetum cinerariifolium]